MLVCATTEGHGTDEEVYVPPGGSGEYTTKIPKAHLQKIKKPAHKNSSNTAIQIRSQSPLCRGPAMAKDLAVGDTVQHHASDSFEGVPAGANSGMSSDTVGRMSSDAGGRMSSYTGGGKPHGRCLADQVSTGLHLESIRSANSKGQLFQESDAQGLHGNPQGDRERKGGHRGAGGEDAGEFEKEEWASWGRGEEVQGENLFGEGLRSVVAPCSSSPSFLRVFSVFCLVACHSEGLSTRHPASVDAHEDLLSTK